MPNAWSDKDKRQCELIKESENERGHSEDRAEKVAARPVNEQRNAEGRTQEQQGKKESK